MKTPWLLGRCAWTPEREAEAVLWLSGQTRKPVLHLSTRDYREHHLSSLVARHGAAEPLNGEIFNRLIAKIRGKSKLPAGERIVVFSPHPDDDVISMGGILSKLAQNGNEITVAYQTSGNIAVFDHEVRRYLDFVERASPGIRRHQRRGQAVIEQIEQYLPASRLATWMPARARPQEDRFGRPKRSAASRRWA